MSRTLGTDSPSTEKTKETFQKTIQEYLRLEKLANFDEIRVRLCKKFPILSEIVREIEHTEMEPCSPCPEGKRKEYRRQLVLRGFLIQAIYVITGVKPVLVVEQGHDGVVEVVKKLFRNFPGIKLVSPSCGNSYLINEQPLPEFDPRRFIRHRFESIEQLVTTAFPRQCRDREDKSLSYALGFGPTWQALPRLKRLDEEVPGEEHFSDEHYLQLGRAWYQRKPDSILVEPAEENDAFFISLGKEFSEKYSSHDRSGLLGIFLATQEQAVIDQLYTAQVVGKISFYTDYIQKVILLKKRILEIFQIRNLNEDSPLTRGHR